jgi:hypothetical protein
MRRVVAVAILALTLVGAVWVSVHADDPKPKAEPAVEHDFGKKVVFVRTSNPKTDNFGFTYSYLQKAQVRRLGDRSFLVGEVAGEPGKENPYEGIRIWVPLSVVLEMSEFESLEMVQKMYEKRKAEADKN